MPLHPGVSRRIFRLARPPPANILGLHGELCVGGTSVVIRHSPEGRNRKDFPPGVSSSSDAAQSRRQDTAVPGIGDTELILRIAEHDEGALRLLVESMRVPVFTFVRQIVLDDHVAEEVTQDTFLVVWKNASRFEAGRRVVPWVFAIARNLAWTAARSSARRSKHLAAVCPTELELPASSADPHAEAEWALWSLIWWLSVPTWMYLDRVVATRSAGRSAILWGLAGLVGNGVALLAYLAASRSRRWAAGETADTPIS